MRLKKFISMHLHNSTRMSVIKYRPYQESTINPVCCWFKLAFRRHGLSQCDLRDTGWHACILVNIYLLNKSLFATLGTSGYQAPLVRTGDFGRSSYLITEKHLRFLLSCGFVIAQIAEILDVSVSTVKRRLRYEWQLQGIQTIYFPLIAGLIFKCLNVVFFVCQFIHLRCWTVNNFSPKNACS